MNHLATERTSKAGRLSGQAMVEFILIIPILFVFLLAVLEYSYMFVQAQRVSALSREAANAAYRDCSSYTDAVELSGCLELIGPPLKQNASSFLPDFGAQGCIIISIYAYTTNPANAGTANANVKSVQRLVQKSYNGAVFVSRYDPGSAVTAETGNSLAQKQGAVAVGEVFFNYQPVTVIGSLMKDVLPQSFYEITVY